MVKSYQGNIQDSVLSEYPLTEAFMAAGLVFDPSKDIFKAMDDLLAQDLTEAAVVDSSGELLGVLSERDCLKLITHLAYHNNNPAGTVADYMTDPIATLQPTMDLMQTVEVFTRTGRRKLVVVGRHNRYMGVVRRRDLLEFIRKFKAGRIQAFQH